MNGILQALPAALAMAAVIPMVSAAQRKTSDAFALAGPRTRSDPEARFVRYLVGDRSESRNGNTRTWPGSAQSRSGGGLGAVPDPQLSPTPGLDTIFPHMVIQGTPDTTFTLTGINFVKKSQVLGDGVPVPTSVTGRTQLSFVVDANDLKGTRRMYR